MWTTRKQFPVNWLTSRRLAFMIQRAKARRSQQMKKNGGLSGGSLRLNAGIDPTSDLSRIGRDETC